MTESQRREIVHTVNQQFPAENYGEKEVAEIVQKVLGIPISMLTPEDTEALVESLF